VCSFEDAFGADRTILTVKAEIECLLAVHRAARLFPALWRLGNDHLYVMMLWLLLWLAVADGQSLEAVDGLSVERGGGEADFALKAGLVIGGREEFGSTVEAEVMGAGEDQHVFGLLRANCALLGRFIKHLI
jgi:hypothetical protein